MRSRPLDSPPSGAASRLYRVARAPACAPHVRRSARATHVKGFPVGSVIKKRRKRMAKKKHRKLLKKTRVQRRKLGK